MAFGAIGGKGSGTSDATGIAADGSGNSYVTGYFRGTVDFDPGAGTVQLVAAGDDDFFVAKYDATGSLAWVASHGSQAGEYQYGYGIAADGAGNSYVTGYFAGTVDFDPGAGTVELVATDGADQFFVAKYDASGSLAWAVAPGTTDGYYAYTNGIAVDGSGNSYVTGYFDGAMDFDPGAATVMLVATGDDHFVAKYDAAGSLVWVVGPGGSSDGEQGYGIAVDGSGNSYVTGNFQGTVDFDPGDGTAELVATGDHDHFVAKYDAAGSLAWVVGPGGSSASEYGNGIAVDGSGNSYVTGYFQGTVDFDPGDATAQLVASGAQDYFVAKYDDTGSLAWVAHPGSSPTYDTSNGIAVDGSGNSYITGYFFGTVDFDPGVATVQLVATGGGDHFVAKYDAAGSLDWVVGPGTSTGAEHGRAIAFDGLGKVYIAGDFKGTADFDPSGDALTLSSTKDNYFVAVYTGDGALDVPDTIPPTVSAPDLDELSDSGADSTDNLTNYPTPTFTGTGEVDATVVLIAGTDTLGAATVDGDGNWSITADSMADGDYVAFARITDAAGNSDDGDTLGFTIDTGAPTVSAPDLAAASDSGVSSSDNLTNDATPTFNGKGEAGARVELVADSVTLGSATINGMGKWTLSADSLTDGDYTAFVRVTDLAGNSDDGDTLGFTIDTAVTVSAPDLDGLSDSGADSTDNKTNDVTPTFTGTGEIGAAVVLIAGAATLGAATVDGDGNWSIDADSMSDGDYAVFARITDLAGNSDDSDTLDITIDTGVPTVSAPDLTAGTDSGTSPSDNLTNDATPTFNGTGEAGATVELVADSVTLGSATINGMGKWTLSADSLTDGDYVAFARVTDLAGNSDDGDTLGFTIDTAVTVSAPDMVGASDSGADSTDNMTNDPTPTFTGTGEIGATVLLIAGADTLGAATVDGDGDWSIDADSMSDGDYAVFARITDLAGNIDDSDTLDITIDTGAPTVSAPDLAAASDSGVSSSDNLTNDATPTFNGKGEAGARVELVADSVTLGSATINGMGKWTLSADSLTDGDYTAFVRVTDLAGNSADGDTLGFTIDTTVTVSAPDLDGASDSGADSTDNKTNDVTPTFTGTGEIGATVLLIAGTDTLGAATVDGAGDWSITTNSLISGDYTAFARITDLAGNTDDGDTLGFTIDTIQPTVSAPDLAAASDSGASSVDNITNADTLTFTGTGEIAATVELFADSLSLGFATVGGDGKWSVATDTLVEGDHAVFARITDAAGNFFEGTTLAVTVDRTAPGTSVTDAPSGVQAVGSASFTFASDDTAAGFQAALDSGGYVTVGNPHTVGGLNDGSHSLRVRAVDLAGNVDASAETVNWSVQLDGTPPAAPVILAVVDDTGEPDGVTTDRSLIVSGTAEALSTVHLLRDGTEIDTVLADADGDWSWADPATLAFGRHVYTAFAEDVSGNDGPLSDAVAMFVVDTKGTAGNGGDLVQAAASGGNIDGKNGDDTIFGESGNDTLKGGNGDDLLLGGGGKDALWGGNGADEMQGGLGNDTLYGEVGNDSLEGGDGGDRLEGGAGSDMLDGEAGADTLYGGAGTDTLTGGPGADRLFGDADGDWIVLGNDGAKDAVYGPVAYLTDDTIVGFETGLSGDVVAITGLASNKGKLLDSIAITDGILSLSKVGGGSITFDDMTGTHYTDTMLGSDGAILVYVI